jgi:hypothetical protein
MMGKKVVVIAAGVTEREALPHLTRHLIQSGFSIIDVRIPPRNRPLIPRQARDLIVATWWDLSRRNAAPDKFVVLVDADGKSPDTKIAAFQDACAQLHEIQVPRLVAVAQWHLEAWFFADAYSLRDYLGRDLGAVDAANPDGIVNPKLHLKHLLGHIYTSQVAGEIARRLSPEIIRGRSPSFAAFEASVRNGNSQKS